MSRAKAIGTRAESAVVTHLRAAGVDAHRTPPSGAHDVGDIHIQGGRVVLEVKSRQSAPSPEQVERWMGELERECMRVPACDIGVLVVKRPGYGAARAGDWWCVMRLDEFHHLLCIYSGPTPVVDAHRLVTVNLATLTALLVGEA